MTMELRTERDATNGITRYIFEVADEDLQCALATPQEQQAMMVGGAPTPARILAHLAIVARTIERFQQREQAKAAVAEHLEKPVETRTSVDDWLSQFQTPAQPRHTIGGENEAKPG